MSKCSKLNLNTFALSCCIAAQTCCVDAAMQQLSAKVFKLSLEYYLPIYSPKVTIFAEKSQTCIINVSSKVRFTENIEIQPEQDPLFNFCIPYCKSQTPPLPFDEDGRP